MIMLCLERTVKNHLLFLFLCIKEQSVEKILKIRSIDETWEQNAFMFTAKDDLNHWNIFVNFWIYIICKKEVLIIEWFIFFYLPTLLSLDIIYHSFLILSVLKTFFLRFELNKEEISNIYQRLIGCSPYIDLFGGLGSYTEKGSKTLP